MRKDILLAVRGLWQSPVFALTAILTIALGIGASTAIFSVTNAVLLRPLPYKDPERLVLGWAELRVRHVTDGTFSADWLFDLRKGVPMFEDLAALFTFRYAVPAEDGTLEPATFAEVTPNFFRTLGAHMTLGRDFTEADGLPQPPADPAARGGAAPARAQAVSILSYEYWQRRYGSDPNVVGRTINGALVVGVLEPNFELLFPPSANVERKPEIWSALRLEYDQKQRYSIGFRLVGRMRPGVTLDQIQGQVESVAADCRRDYVLERASDFHVRLEPMHKDLVAEVRPAILALMGAVIFLLLIACANVANLLLVRASLRERELSVRTALGASRWRLMRQMLMESFVIAGLGTVLGLGLARLGIHQLIVMGPTNLPRLGSIAIDAGVLAFSAAAGLVAAAIFGLVPALRASRPDVMQVLRGSGRTASLGGGRRLRNAAVVIEVALSFVLLIGSGLMFRSFVALQHIDRGYDPQGLLTFLLVGGRGNARGAERGAFVHDLQSRLAALPGVRGVSAASPFPLDGRFNPLRWGKEEAQGDPSKFQAADCEQVLPGYFETMHTRLIDGRTFTDADNLPTRSLVVIDEMLAKKAFPHESAIGKRLLIRVRSLEPEFVEIIGVVAHQREMSLAQVGREQYYLTDGFVGHGAADRWAIRTGGDPAHFVGAVRAELAKVDPHAAMFEVQPMDALVEKAEAGTRFSLLLIGAFAAIAVLLAGVGLYGVLSTVVRQRTSEIGVRMALGAAPSRIFNLVIGHGLRLSAAGIALGSLAALGLTRVMSTMLVGVKATDPATYAAMAALFFAIAAMACWVPGRRAAGLDPIVALRDE